MKHINCFLFIKKSCSISTLTWQTVDEMGARIDDLEKNIGELMTQAGVDEPEKWHLPSLWRDFCRCHWHVL